MYRESRIRIGLIFGLGALLCLGGCAKQGYPPGGLEDRIGPEVVACYPTPQALGVKTEARPWIRLNEYPLRASVAGAIFVSPEPESGYEIKVKGKRIEIRFADPLPPGRTVLITFGSGIKDLRGNQMRESFVLAFSTGDSLDRAAISGYVDGMENSAATWIWAYPLETSKEPDPRKEKAPFAVQPEMDGHFALSFLPTGMYRLFAVLEARRNRLWDSKQEAIGFAPRDVEAGTDSIPSINMMMSICDLEPPKLLGAAAIHRQGMRLSFDEPVVIATAKIEAHTESSQDGINLPIIDAYQNPGDSAAILLTTAMQREGDSYRLNIQGIADQSGNVADSISAAVEAAVQTDTVGPRLSFNFPAENAMDIDPQAAIYLGFSEAITLVDLPRAVSVMDSGETPLAGKWSYLSASLGSFLPQRPLTPGVSIKINLVGDSLHDIFGNASPDSFVTIQFHSLDVANTGSISGQILNAEADLRLALHRLGKQGGVWDLAVGEDGQFRVEKLPAGGYRLWAYGDRNGDHHHTLGRLDPFVFSEPFLAGADTVKIRSRWETENLVLTWRE